MREADVEGAGMRGVGVGRAGVGKEGIGEAGVGEPGIVLEQAGVVDSETESKNRSVQIFSTKLR